MANNIKLVVTTISSPNKVLTELAKGCQFHNWDFIIIGDTKSPKDFALEGSEYYDIDAQLTTNLEYAQLCPTRHYARKNIGYLLAIKAGAELIVETDDDNLPLDSFWHPTYTQIEAKIIDNAGWVNVYKYFSNSMIWPRGFPLDQINQLVPAYEDLIISTSECPIQQGLADDNPDVDAIYRLILPLPIQFADNIKLALGTETWCPFNSQNTVWFPPVYPLLYLPAYCSFRMTDIWRSFVAQRICWENGWRILFHSPTVYQERNKHNLMRDFEDEVSGYLNNSQIAKSLSELKLLSGEQQIPDNLRKCYDTLIQLNLVKQEEAKLLDTWLKDLRKVIGYA
ncbi:STELLO glycosyltransferase family protein [Dapis sp. BLCC M126]|uniref:STELLO glycosyltransferase family protein n=1 Tax=Dapis sp. BLCC M126 TaxID=3400189 RepID=UPI003CF11F40